MLCALAVRLMGESLLLWEKTTFDVLMYIAGQITVKETPIYNSTESRGSYIEVWLSRIRRVNFSPTDNTRICW